MVKRLCISVADEDAVWLDENKISPSKLLQTEINRIKEIQQNADATIKDFKMKLEVREELITKLNEKIATMGDLLSKNGIIQ